MGLFRRKSWEERQAERLSKLRATRKKEEGRANIRMSIEREQTRIAKAKGRGRGSGSDLKSKLGKIGRGMEEFGRFSNVAVESFGRMDDFAGGPFQGPDPFGGSGRRSSRKSRKSKKSTRKSSRERKRQTTINF